MNKEKDTLDDFFRERLADYKRPVETDIFASLEKSIPSPKLRKSRTWLWIASSCAAAIVLTFLLLNNKSFFPANEIITPKEIALEEELHSDPVVADLPPSEMWVEETKSTQITKLLKTGEKRNDLFSEIIALDIVQNDEPEVTPKTETETQVEPKEEPKQKEDLRELKMPASAELPPVIQSKPISKNWNLSLSTNGVLLANNYNTPVSIQNKANLRGYSNNANIGSKNFNGMSDDQLIGIDYSIPLSIAFLLTKSINERWSVETGIIYSRLHSKEKWYAAEYDMHQTNNVHIHYLGVPVKLSYKFWQTKTFSAYTSAGGAVEKAIAADITSVTHNGLKSKKNLSVPGLQLSVLANLGIEYQFIKSMGIFFEPGVVYYFDDSNDIQTIRKDKPLNFSLQLGLRYNF